MFFVVFDAAGFGDRIETIRSYRPRIADGLIDFAEGTRRYWIVTTVFGLIVAALDVIGLLIIGVPLAFTWGAGLRHQLHPQHRLRDRAGPAGPDRAARQRRGSAIAVAALYIVVNVVVQTLIQPRFTGDAVGISPTVAFLSLIVWAYLLGVLGALLAVPATQFVKSLLVDHQPPASGSGRSSTPVDANGATQPVRVRRRRVRGQP